HLHIDAGRLARIGFDFNLLASNLVDLAARTVTVSPVIVASVVPADAKPIRVRGGLFDVDQNHLSFRLQIEPFHERRDGSQDNLFAVRVNADTPFEINGHPYQGAAGLDQMQALPPTTIIAAFGSLGADHSFTARQVLVGTSLEGGGDDHLVGSVVAR